MMYAYKIPVNKYISNVHTIQYNKQLCVYNANIKKINIYFTITNNNNK